MRYLPSIVFISLCLFLLTSCQTQSPVAKHPPAAGSLGYGYSGVYVEEVEFKGTKYHVFRWERGNGSAMQVIEVKEKE